MLTFHWLLSAAAFAVAAAALVRARRLSRRLERLTESYWELRYEHGQLRGRVAKLDPDASQAAPGVSVPQGATAFVPLSSLVKGGRESA